MNSSIEDFTSDHPDDRLISQYLREIARTPLLSADEEAELARQIEAGQKARAALTRAGGELDPAQQADLEHQVRQGEQARQAMLEANTLLVISVAKRYLGRGVSFLDLIQEGNLGLMRAVEKFDHRRGLRFSTYATWWVRQAVVRAVADQSHTIRIPVYLHELTGKFVAITQRLTQQLGREPTDEEIAAELGIDPETVEHLRQVKRVQDPLSLDWMVYSDDGDEKPLLAILNDEDAVPVDDQAFRRELRRKIRRLLDELEPRQARILELRFGLRDGQCYTLEEIGQKVGLTRERVRQIEAKVLSKLRHPRHARGLIDFLR